MACTLGQCFLSQATFLLLLMSSLLQKGTGAESEVEPMLWDLVPRPATHRWTNCTWTSDSPSCDEHRQDAALPQSSNLRMLRNIASRLDRFCKNENGTRVDKNECPYNCCNLGKCGTRSECQVRSNRGLYGAAIGGVCFFICIVCVAVRQCRHSKISMFGMARFTRAPPMEQQNAPVVTVGQTLQPMHVPTSSSTEANVMLVDGVTQSPVLTAHGSTVQASQSSEELLIHI